MRNPLTTDRPDWIWVNSPKRVKELRRELKKCRLIALDTETTGLNIWKDRVMFCTVSTGYNGYFFEEEYLDHFDDIFQDPNKQWVGSQVKYDFNIMANSGHPVAGDLLCTLTMDRVLNSHLRHGLKEVYSREFDEHMPDISELFYPRSKAGKPVKPKGKSVPEVLWDAWESRTPEERKKVIGYATLDAYGVLRLFHALRKQLMEIKTYWGPSLFDVFMWYEVPLSRELYEMERFGIQIDVEYLKTLGPQMEARAEEVKRKMQKQHSQLINPLSNRQVVNLLYDQLGLKPIKMTSGGVSGKKSPSVAQDILLQHAADGVEVAQDIVTYKSVLKMKTNYVDKLQDLVDRGNRVHATFKQWEAQTGRLSVSDPPLQQIPKTESDEFKLRMAFIAGPGNVIIGADYDQVEMVVTAHNSADPTMCSAVREGRDIHSANVATVWGVPYEEVVAAKTKSENKDNVLSDKELDLILKRFGVKSVGFGILYGKAARSLGEQLGYPDQIREDRPNWPDWKVKRASKNKAQDLIDLVFRGMPSVQNMIAGVHYFISENQYSETLLGRRRWFLQTMPWGERMAHQESAGKLCWCGDCKAARDADREGLNNTIQGTVADIMMLVMIKCGRSKRLRALGARMCLQVHDELLFECPEETAKEAAPIIKRIMENPGIKLRVPLRATPKIGKSWFAVK